MHEVYELNYKTKIKNEIFPLTNKEIIVYSDMFLKHQESFFEDLENDSKTLWTKNKENNNNQMIAQIIDKYTLLKSQSMLTDFIPMKRDFEKKYDLKSIRYAGPNFFKNLVSEKTNFYPVKHDHNNDLLCLFYYLNDDYEGGKIILPEHNDVIFPQKNSLIIFRENSFEYEITPITSGEQYVFSVKYILEQ